MTLVASFRHEKTALDDDGLTFDFQSVLWEDHGQYYFVRHPEETFDLEKLDKVPIPVEHLCPTWHPSLPVALDPNPEDSYIKPPNVVYYRGDDRIAEYLLGEAHILSQLEKDQHPNIVRFRGCILTDDGLINGLCLKLYPRTLADSIGRRVDDDFKGRTSSEHLEGLDHADILQGIVAGVKFIHSVGLVHNDLNPRNVMLDEFNNPIIVDFDSCKVVGTSMKGQKSFTSPWGRRNAENKALYENDYLSLGLLELYLKGAYPPVSGPFSRKLDPEIIDHAITTGKHLVGTATSSVTLN